MRITNNGPRITETDYWASAHAARGYTYLSVNAGTIRLLVPPTDPARLLEETRGATRAAAQLAGAAAVGVVHVVFDDETESPAFVSLPIAQCDRSLPLGESGRWARLALYTSDETHATRFVREMPVLIRPAARAIDSSPVLRPRGARHD